MKDPTRTNPKLIGENALLKQRIQELEQSESERKQAEEALQESDDLFRSLVDYMHDAMIILNWDGSILFANRAAARIIEYDRAEELVGHNMLEYIHPDSIQKAAEDLEAVKADKMGFLSEYQLWSVTGRHIWVESIGGKIIFRRATANLACIRDITDRKQAEEALIASEEHYRSLVENASDVVFWTDDTGHFTFVNPAALRISGYKEDEIISKHYKMFIRPDMFKEVITLFANQLIKKIQNTYSEYPILTKEGHEVWLGQNTQLIVEAGHIVGFQAVARDITGRKRMEKELSDSEKKYRTMLDNIHDGYYEVNLLGNLTFVNPSMSRILGYSEEELIGMNNRQYMDEENAKKVFRAFNMVYKTEAPTSHFEWEVIRKDRTKAFVGCSVSLIKDSFDKPIGFRGIVRDTTDKKKAEEALQDSEKRYRELSIIDDLTQLYNSRYFYDQLKSEIDRVNRYGQPLTLLLLDLDNFKVFNDSYGHIEGDQVLSRLGQVAKRCLRQTDSAYRYGGEEFTILLPMTTSKDASVTAERIRTEFKKENFPPVSGKEVHMTVSIGLAQYQPQEDMKAFVHRVDQLMYQAKKNGRDRVCSES